MKELQDNDIAKELLTYISYFDEENKLLEQNISEDCKNILSILYYTYLSDSNEKNNIIDIWLNNERINKNL